MKDIVKTSINISGDNDNMTIKIKNHCLSVGEMKDFAQEIGNYISEELQGERVSEETIIEEERDNEKLEQLAIDAAKIVGVDRIKQMLEDGEVPEGLVEGIVKIVEELEEECE